MTSEVDNWNSRLAVAFKREDGATELISPITNFNPTIQISKDIIDSIDAHNLGYSSGNPRFSFDFEITAINKQIFREILTTAVQGARFAVCIATRAGESDDWYLDSIEFNNCVITDIAPSNVTNDGKAPTAKFGAICLDFTATNDGFSMSPTHTTGATGSLTGSTAGELE